MKKILLLAALVGASSLQALTVRSDFLRAAQVVKHAQFPLNLKGYLHLSFKLDIDKSEEGIEATVDRLIKGKVVDTYKGLFVLGERKAITFSDGSIGPSVLLEADQEDIEMPAEQETEKKLLNFKQVAALAGKAANE